MKNYIFILSFAFGLISFGQEVEFKSANFKDDKDGFKKAKDEMDIGTELFILGNEAVFMVQDPKLNYKKALKYFEKAYVFNPKSADVNFKIAVCHFYSPFKAKSVAFFKEAYKLNPEIDPFMHYYMGIANQLEGNYKGALGFYAKFEAGYKRADNFNKFVKKRNKECTIGIQMEDAPKRVWIDNLTIVNTEFNDFAPSITMDGEELVFTSDRPNGHTADEVGEFDNDIYTTSFVDGKWKKPATAKGRINTETDDLSNNFSYNGTKMLISRINAAGNYDIYETVLKGDSWGEPINFSLNINSKSNDIYASYSYNDVKIYFAKDNASGSSKNGFDIYSSGIMNRAARKYGTPTRVMKTSSPFNDGPIYLHPDGETMYFASEGFNSMGGFDIFMVKKEGSAWGTPVNMGYPINTPYDDFFFASSANGKYAYITSNRKGGKGGYDIYKATFWGPEKEPATSVEDYLLASIAKPINDPVLASEIKVTKSINLTVFKGKTLDALTKKQIEAVIEITDNTTGKVIESFTTNSATGKFLISLKSGGNYGIAVKANGYLFHSENFDIPSGSAYNLVNKTIELKNIKIGSKIALRNVFFDTGKSTIKSESNTELDRLVKLMKDVPGLKIELSGHTDNTGSASGNQKLSQSRADAVVAYLVSKGVSKSRFTSKGYGDSKPVASNSTNEGRQLNRRTEFEIIAN
jgi:outer membrane protein OmpA-like peptidoglycan-associated protein/tetratricopeptide (TPR) repeat protein